MEDFAFCVNSCEVEEIPFEGNPFTWWNGRPRPDCIFKRLDRLLENLHLMEWFSTMEVDHLPKTGSDNAPMFLTMSTGHQPVAKPFKFLSFWVDISP